MHDDDHDDDDDPRPDDTGYQNKKSTYINKDLFEDLRFKHVNKHVISLIM